MPASGLIAKMQPSQLRLCGTRSGQKNAVRDRSPRTGTDVADTASKKDPLTGCFLGTQLAPPDQTAAP